MSTIKYYSKEALVALQQELHNLKTKERKKVTKQIAEARDKGDLSENAEYDAAKEAQVLLELKISKLEKTIANARTLDKKDIDISKVSILTKVQVQNQQNNQKTTYTIVSEKEVNTKQNKISATSPIGKGLLGKQIGQTAQIPVPSGIIQLKILNITT